MKICVIIAGKDPRALYRTMCSVEMQCAVDAPQIVTVDCADNACAAWKQGAQQTQADYVLLLKAGDVLFDAYTLWRLLQPLCAQPAPDAVAGALNAADAWFLPQGKLIRRDVLFKAEAEGEKALAAVLYALCAQDAEIPEAVCDCGPVGGLLEDAADALEKANAPQERCAAWAERCLRALYLRYVRAGLESAEKAQEERARCAAFFRAVWLRFEAHLNPETLFASYAAAMEAAMQADPEGAGGFEPYPMFADLLRMEV